MFAAVLAAGVMLAGCGPAEPVANKESEAMKVATFRGGEVTQAELNEFAQQSGAGQLEPGSPQYKSAIQTLLPQLVGVEVTKAYAEEHGITVSDEEVDGELAKIKKRIGEQARSQGQDLSNQKAFDQALQQYNLTEDQLRQDIRENLPVQKVQEKVAGDAKPSESEVKKFYDENKEAQFTTTDQRCVRHILFNKDQEKKAKEVKSQLEDDGDFAKLARENSQDPGSAEKGGDLGCVGEGQTVAEFEKAAFGADVGEIVGPVKSQFGYHVLEVTDKKPKQTRALKEVEPQIKKQLAAQKKAEKFQAWIDDQQKERNVKYMKGFKPAKQQG